MTTLPDRLRALHARQVHACVCPTTGEQVFAVQATAEGWVALLEAAAELDKQPTPVHPAPEPSTC